MNKKLIAAAIAAVMAAPVVSAADTTLYGKLHLSVDSIDNAAYDGMNVTDRDSRIGVKGSEDLGNGLKAVFKSEWSMALDGDRAGDTVRNNRDQYIGLAGSFGTFLLAGNVNTPYKNSTGKMDFFGDELADYNNSVGMEDNRADNAVVYISPNFSGAQFAAAGVAGETAANNGLADGYSLALTYNNAGIMGAIAHENLEDLGGTDEKWRVGLGYTMDAFKVAAVYENSQDATAGDIDRFTLSGAYTMGNNTIKAMYGNQDVDGGAETDAWAIGADHKFSKRTKVYAQYADSERGLRAQSEGNYGGDTSGFSLGMVHNF